MAASLSPAQKKENFNEEFLTCSICAESFDNADHRAKCLPCLHTFCKSCLQKLVGKETKINCPKCRSSVTLPGGTVDSLTNNFIVENLKEYQDIFNLAVSCGSCKTSGANSFCHNCGLFLCEKCKDVHSQFGPLQHHRVSSMTELQESEFNPRIHQRHHCSKHPTQDVTMYCKERECKVPVCATCGLLDHQGHDLIELSAAIEKVVSDMRRLSKTVNDRSELFTSKKTEFKDKQERLTANFKEQEKTMQDYIQKLHSEIDERYNKAKSELKNMYELEMNHLTGNIDGAERTRVQMTSACEFANQACDISNPTQLLDTHKQITDRLCALENAPVPQDEHGVFDFRFTEEHQSAATQIQNSLKDLCTISITCVSDLQKIDPKSCTIIWKQPCEKEYYPKATVHTRNKYGVAVITGGAKVEAKQSNGEMFNVQDNNDGTYSFTYNRWCDSITVKINGTEMKESPFQQDTFFCY